MNKAIIYVGSVVIGATVGYFATRAISKCLPDRINIKLPFGGTVKATRRTK